jgi:hypothetical protein
MDFFSAVNMPAVAAVEQDFLPGAKICACVVRATAPEKKTRFGGLH